MFRAVDAVVVNKVDLLPHLQFDMDLFRRNLADVNPQAHVLELSAQTGEGMDQWTNWLRSIAASR